MTKRSADAILGALEELHADMRCVPTRSDVIYYDDELLGEIGSEFGTLERAIEASSIDHERIFIQDIQNVVAEVGHAPTRSEFKRHGEHGLDQITSYLGPWTNVLNTAGETESEGQEPRHRSDDDNNQPAKSNKRTTEQSTDTNPSTESVSRDDLLEDLQRIKRVINREPTKDDYVRLGNYGLDAVKDRFGNWGSFIGTADADQTDGNQPADTVQPTTKAKWEDIPDNARLDDPIAVKVLEVDRNPGPRKSTVLAVTESSGRELPVNIWEKHPDPMQWEVGESYLLHNVRGTVWESNGSTRKLLDSTRDIEVESLNELSSGQNDDSTVEESETQADGSDRIESLMDDLDDLL